MADQDLVNYLKEGKKRGFEVLFLKEQLLNAGWDERDVNDAIEELNSEEVSKPVSMQPSLFKKEEKKRIKWMKIAGIIGMIFLILQVVVIIYPFITQKSTGQLGAIEGYASTVQNIIPNPGTIIALLILFLAVFELYVFGFVKMGKKTDSGLLRLSAIIFMIAPAVAIILGIISYNMLISVFTAFGELMAAGSMGVLNLTSNLSYILVMWIVFILLSTIILLLFSAGLLKLRAKIQAAFISGIFYLCAFFVSIAIIAVLMITVARINRIGIVNLLLQGSPEIFSLLNILNYVYYAGIVIVLLATFFGSLALLHASKKFE